MVTAKNSVITYIALLFWSVLVVFFVRELYVYAFVHAMGIHDALLMFGEKMQSVLMGFGVFTPFLFMLLYILRPIVLFPASVMTITSVFLFGAVGGFIISYVGELFSAIVAFFIGRYFGEELGLTKKALTTKIGTYFHGNPFTSIFALRLVPLFPFDFVNYSAGIFKLPFSPYLTGTAVGVLPGLSAYIFLGFSFMHTQYLLAAAIVFVLLIAISHFTKKRLSRKHLSAKP